MVAKNIPKLSVIIPAYNQEKYIERCINSVKKCGVKNVEIIVVNDGSTDNTPKILKKINGIKIINQKKGSRKCEKCRI